MLEYKGYIGTVEAEDGIFFGRVVGLRDVITFEGTTFAEVEQAFRDSIDDYLAFCAERSEPADRPYSGRPRAYAGDGPLVLNPGAASRQSRDPPAGDDALPVRGTQPQSMDRPADRKRRLSFVKRG